MIDILMTMLQDGAVSQGAGGMHLFDMFTETRMKEKGAKKTLNFGSDETDGDNDAALMKGFGGHTLELHLNVLPAAEDQIEILNLDGDDDYCLTVTDSSGNSTQVYVTLVGEGDDAQLQIHGNLDPGQIHFLARKFHNLNNSLGQMKSRTPGTSISNAHAEPLYPHPHGHDDDHSDDDHDDDHGDQGGWER